MEQAPESLTHLGDAPRNWRKKLAKLRRQIEQTTCSASWADQCWNDGATFPPPAPTTPMRVCECERCRRSGKLWPAYYSATTKSGDFISYECWLESLSDLQAARLPSSPTGLILSALRNARVKVRRRRSHTVVDLRFSGSPGKKKKNPKTHAIVTPKKRIFSSVKSLSIKDLKVGDPKKVLQK